jgi:hypothetical protein
MVRGGSATHLIPTAQICLDSHPSVVRLVHQSQAQALVQIGLSLRPSVPHHARHVAQVSISWVKEGDSRLAAHHVLNRLT